MPLRGVVIALNRNALEEIETTMANSVLQRPFHPANAKSEAIASSRTTMIAEGIRITGQNLEIVAEDKLQIDGTITGNLFAAEIVIGASGRVEGVAVADRMEVRGTLIGTVFATNLAIGIGGRVGGDVHYRSLALAQGGTLEGTVCRLADTSALPQPRSDQAT